MYYMSDSKGSGYFSSGFQYLMDGLNSGALSPRFHPVRGELRFSSPGYPTIPTLWVGWSQNHRITLDKFSGGERAILRQMGIESFDGQHTLIHNRNMEWLSIKNYDRRGWCYSRASYLGEDSEYGGIMFTKGDYVFDHKAVDTMLKYELNRLVGLLEQVATKDTLFLYSSPKFQKGTAALLAEAQAYYAREGFPLSLQSSYSVEDEDRITFISDLDADTWDDNEPK